ncbi:MarR family transcriptional regulator [Methanoregula sp.]|uniref:MarR family transcriptional regulator n=1 Tax=Methanoregula sp. TaxID=2052170 RepID=UPI003BB016B1
MKQENIQYFTKEGEEFVNLLISTGVKEHGAMVLAFLSSTSEGTFQDIEQGIGLRQPDASVTIKYLMDQDWIKSHETTSGQNFRPTNVWQLKKPITVILDGIESEKKKEAGVRLTHIRKFRNNLSHYPKRKESISLLVKSGIKKPVAQVLVFLANTPRATLQEIESGTDTFQSNVSAATQYLVEKGWIKHCTNPSGKIGMPKRAFDLAQPITAIADGIEKEMIDKDNSQLENIKKMRNFDMTKVIFLKKDLSE